MQESELVHWNYLLYLITLTFACDGGIYRNTSVMNQWSALFLRRNALIFLLQIFCEDLLFGTMNKKNFICIFGWRGYFLCCVIHSVPIYMQPIKELRFLSCRCVKITTVTLGRSTQLKTIISVHNNFRKKNDVWLISRRESSSHWHVCTI